jgi:Apea-like HEPN
VTALEALIGAKEELAFKLSFRVASILANDDEERAELLLKIKQFYTTRSRIVHGGRLRQQDRDLVTDDSPLRGIVRQILRATLHLAVDEGKQLTPHFVDEELDRTLVHSENREALRKEMGLSV